MPSFACYQTPSAAIIILDKYLESFSSLRSQHSLPPLCGLSPLLSSTRACITEGGGDFSSLSFPFSSPPFLFPSLFLPLSSLLATEIISVGRGVISLSLSRERSLSSPCSLSHDRNLVARRGGRKSLSIAISFSLFSVFVFPLCPITSLSFSVFRGHLPLFPHSPSLPTFSLSPLTLSISRSLLASPRGDRNCFRRERGGRRKFFDAVTRSTLGSE